MAFKISLFLETFIYHVNVFSFNSSSMHFNCIWESAVFPVKQFSILNIIYLILRLNANNYFYYVCRLISKRLASSDQITQFNAFN